MAVSTDLMPERFERHSRAGPAVAADELSLKVARPARVPSHRDFAAAALFELLAQGAHVDLVLLVAIDDGTLTERMLERIHRRRFFLVVMRVVLVPAQV